VKPFGIYVHIPFCARKCFYCDFYTLAGRHAEEFNRFVEALLCEIDCAASEFALRPAATVYFGGGTPSLLAPEQIQRILERIHQRIDIKDGAEITLEVNPGTADAAHFTGYKNIGVNRLSMGAQTFDDSALRNLGRTHTADDTRTAIAFARSAGFLNINLDLMFAMPGQTLESFRQDVAAIVALSPEHISAYSLIIEEGTPFAYWHKQGRLNLPAEEIEAQMYEEAEVLLASAGYHQYEISNWCKPGFEARHNLLYWTNGEYFGFGPGAHSYFQGRRFANPRDLAAYHRSADMRSFPRELADILSPPAQASEAAMLRLRLTEGLKWRDLEREFPIGVQELLGARVNRLMSQGLLEGDSAGVRLTRSGRLLGNLVFAEFLE
jgi:oxygen-independent coproporphyrinogen-3 oxidase